MNDAHKLLLLSRFFAKPYKIKPLPVIEFKEYIYDFVINADKFLKELYAEGILTYHPKEKDYYALNEDEVTFKKINLLFLKYEEIINKAKHKKNYQKLFKKIKNIDETGLDASINSSNPAVIDLRLNFVKSHYFRKYIIQFHGGIFKELGVDNVFDFPKARSIFDDEKNQKRMVLEFYQDFFNEAPNLASSLIKLDGKDYFEIKKFKNLMNNLEIYSIERIKKKTRAERKASKKARELKVKKKHS